MFKHLSREERPMLPVRQPSKPWTLAKFLYTGAFDFEMKGGTGMKP
jgi:hypothetical protein